MKAITICQPYAHLIMRGEKRVENRTWPTSYRGLIAIHAGKSRQWLDCEADEDQDWTYRIKIADMAFGAVVAVARLVDCLTIDSIEAGKHDTQYPWLREHEHTSGPWCWILDAVSPVGPWPWRGAQGLYDIDDEELDRVANRIIGVSL